MALQPAWRWLLVAVVLCAAPVRCTPASFAAFINLAIGPHRCRSASASALPRLQMQMEASIGIDEDVRKKFKKLQNGSDMRGIAIEGVEGESVNLTPEVVYSIAAGFCKWLQMKHGNKSNFRVSVGRDPRLSGPALLNAACCGIESVPGFSHTSFGICTTPAMFTSCITAGYEYDGALMITASHLPFNRNGIKFFNQEGGTSYRDIAQIAELAAGVYTDSRGSPDLVLKKLATDNYLPVYKQQLTDFIRREVSSTRDYVKPLAGCKVVVNAGNGGGAFFEEMLRDLGADTRGSVNLEPDGTFPNHVPNPEDPEAMECTVAAVLAAGADLGIVLDTDVDRSGLVDGNGYIINRNRLIALMAKIVLRDYPGTCIVTDSVTSNGLSHFITSLGGRHCRYMKGYKNVIDKAIELNGQGTDCQLAIETSGHGALKQNRFLDDGAFLAVKCLVQFALMREAQIQSDTSHVEEAQRGPSIADLIKNLEEPKESFEFRLRVLEGFDVAETAQEAVAAFENECRASGNQLQGMWQLEEENYEGLRAKVHESGDAWGWLQVRKSLHDPMVIVNTESEEDGGMARNLKRLVERCFVPRNLHSKLDLTSILSEARRKNVEIQLS